MVEAKRAQTQVLLMLPKKPVQQAQTLRQAGQQNLAVKPQPALQTSLKQLQQVQKLQGAVVQKALQKQTLNP